jgi:cytochrome c oxidase cbb3-type subunit 3
MCSPCRVDLATLCVLALAGLALAACDRERREIAAGPPEAGPLVRATTLSPGGAAPPPKDPRAAEYEDNAYQVSTGSRLFRWYNCNGCHANGGGGMGPALIDDKWVYGAEIEQIYGSILEGRPNGMPSFRGKATEEQIWALAAYVRSLAGQSPMASSSRRDAMTSVPPRNQVDSSGERKGQ